MMRLGASPRGAGQFSVLVSDLTSERYAKICVKFGELGQSQYFGKLWNSFVELQV